MGLYDSFNLLYRKCLNCEVRRNTPNYINVFCWFVFSLDDSCIPPLYGEKTSWFKQLHPKLRKFIISRTLFETILAIPRIYKQMIENVCVVKFYFRI